MAKSEELEVVAETLAQMSTRLTYWSEFDLAFRVQNLASEVTLLAGGLRVEEENKVDLGIEGAVEV